MTEEGKVAIVTGGTRGIGAAIARTLAQRGAKLVLNGRARDPDVDALMDELRTITQTELVLGDAAVPDTPATIVRHAMQRFGRVDYVVAAAGGAYPGTIMDVSEETWLDAFRVHIHAVFHLFKAAHGALAREGGGFLLIGSAAGLRGCPASIAYQTVKGALPSMARALARDHAHEDIRVNAILPGIIRTRFHSAMTAQAERNNLDNRIPLRRFGTSEDVAAAALGLLTNRFITGETLVIDGGMSMRMV